MHMPHAHAMHMPCTCTCRHCDLGPAGDIGEQLARSLSPRRKRASKERWPSSTNTSADSNSSAAWRTFMEGGSSVVSEAGAVSAAGAAGAACEAGAGSEVAGHDCSVEAAPIVPSPPPPHPPPEPPLPPATPPSVKPLALRLTPSPVPRSSTRPLGGGRAFRHHCCTTLTAEFHRSTEGSVVLSRCCNRMTRGGRRRRA